ncbi:hypothetical protein HXX76_008265 [Chlamydomonas incerta]|uniref:Fumarylacetoacetase-like C-terminal domain-containing protein n=1 Tax=Chlamydomonas incerta TaxID=51695 RepID=A0A835SVM3_CHLIN|nr:hypothetical protein HXX76_008265 [Chlamydomonas incerta]|eukprot:KAG2433913.1 hypothetical protein HXX76_008265 [Chlamydomonas incerta]
MQGQVLRGAASAMLRCAGSSAAGASAFLVPWLAQATRSVQAPADPDRPVMLLTPNNVWCIGRNYAEHVRELGNEVQPAGEAPMIFLKAGSSVVPPGNIHLPAWSQDVHHEVELAVELGHDLRPARAAVALDLTARDVQSKLKSKQWPWTLAKSFAGATPLGPAFSLSGVDPTKLWLTLDVNGKRRQTGRTSDMIFSLDTQLNYVRRHFPVVPGDVLLTGTPHGVSRMAAGDEILARVLGPAGEVLSEAVWHVRAASPK